MCQGTTRVPGTPGDSLGRVEIAFRNRNKNHALMPMLCVPREDCLRAALRSKLLTPGIKPAESTPPIYAPATVCRSPVRQLAYAASRTC